MKLHKIHYYDHSLLPLFSWPESSGSSSSVAQDLTEDEDAIEVLIIEAKKW